MINFVDGVQYEENNMVEFNNLNEVFISCLNAIVDTVDEDYNNWITYYLENQNKLDDISISKKIKEIEATGYSLSDCSTRINAVGSKVKTLKPI